MSVVVDVVSIVTGFIVTGFIVTGFIVTGFVVTGFISRGCLWRSIWHVRPVQHGLSGPLLETVPAEPPLQFPRHERLQVAYLLLDLLQEEGVAEGLERVEEVVRRGAREEERVDGGLGVFVVDGDKVGGLEDDGVGGEGGGGLGEVGSEGEAARIVVVFLVVCLLEFGFRFRGHEGRDWSDVVSW